MNDTNLGIAVTLTVGKVAVTVEVKKNDPNAVPIKIEPVKNGGCIEYKG